MYKIVKYNPFRKCWCIIVCSPMNKLGDIELPDAFETKEDAMAYAQTMK